MLPVSRHTVVALGLLLGLGTAFAQTAETKKAAPPAAKAKAKGPALPPNPRKLSPPPGIPVPPDIKLELNIGVAALDNELLGLKTSLHTRPELLELLPDVQIYRNAVKYALEDDIFYSPAHFKSAEALLKQGLERARQLKAGQTPWTTATGLVVRGFVSRIDGSVQPYGLVVPPTFKPGGPPMRLDFWLHGRGDTLNEIAFIEGRQKTVGEFAPADTLVLHPYGRFMNAFKFAGEVDVWECLEHARKHYPVDPRRVTMRGFSMGGAGAWHLGVHHADRWAAVNPGAGFVDVKHYQKLGDKLETIPWYERKLWSMYDPLAAPINLVNTTLVAYSGEEDAQKAAADLMEAALAREGVRMTHLIGPKTGHKYEPETKQRVAALVDAAAARGVTVPAKVTFVTHTLKWNRMHWVTLQALERHWEEARIEADATAGPVTIKTRNVAAFTVAPPRAGGPVSIDGQAVGPLGTGAFRKVNGRWQPGSVPDGAPAKRPGLQGPIDDAFTGPFLMVVPSGEALNPAVDQWVRAELKEARFQWRRQFRGPAQVREDEGLTEEDIRDHHLILWGDPASNKVLAKIADRLPIRWTAAGVQVGGKTYDATRHAPVFIYPNPLNPAKYVVINGGFTFPQYSSGTNSQQTPKLPDWAVVEMAVPSGERVGGKGVVDAAFFGERWELTDQRN